MRHAAFAALILATPHPASADTNTVQDMLPACEEAVRIDPAASLSQGAVYCLGVAYGTAIMLDANCQQIQQDARLGLDRASPIWAATLPPTNGAAVQAFTNWAREHPQNWGGDFVLNLVVALQASFPCIPS